MFGPPLVLLDEDNGREFLRRYRIVQTPWVSVFVHRMQVPDPGSDLHDHPWAFGSLILAGGYDEVTASIRDAKHGQKIRRRARWTWALTRIDECHTIVSLARSPTWTLVVTGPTRRRWGFYVDGAWQDWEHEYDYARRYPWKVGRLDPPIVSAGNPCRPSR